MAQNKMMQLIDASLKRLEQEPEVSEKAIKDIEQRFNKISEISDLTDDEKQAYISRIEGLKNAKGEVAEAASPRHFKLTSEGLKKAKTIGIVAAAVAAVGVGGLTLTSCGKSNQETAIETEVEAENVIDEPEVQEETYEAIKTVLSENLKFDPNSNDEIVNRMADFIVDALYKGVPIKDIMSEEELAEADKADESVVTIAQLMDFYMVMNIEDIDPMDYARLAYNTKTAETITDNYMYCAQNIFVVDALTANVDTEIDYASIIADKDSSEQLQKFVHFLAEYNSASDKKAKGKEISEYIVSEYVDTDANLYSMSANEFVYRLMFTADNISNNSILPKEVNIILNEDGKIECNTSKKDDGIKGKTERAEEFTSIYNVVKEKLEISREFADQDISKVSEHEKKTGVELEIEIRDLALKNKKGYNKNPKFEAVLTSGEASKGNAKGTGKATGAVVTTVDGKKAVVTNEEMAKYGATNLQQYEAAKKAEFEAKAKADSNHVIKNNSGQVVASGTQANAALYNQGYADGYADGNYYTASAGFRSNSPKSSDASYIGGYNAGFAQGRADIQAVLAQQSKTETHYEDVTDQTVSSSESVTEYGYTAPIAVENNNSNNNNSYNESYVEYDYVEAPAENNSNETTTFVPLDDATIVESVETYEEISYQSSAIDVLKNYKAQLLKAANKYSEPENSRGSMKA